MGRNDIELYIEVGVFDLYWFEEVNFDFEFYGLLVYKNLLKIIKGLFCLFL